MKKWNTAGPRARAIAIAVCGVCEHNMANGTPLLANLAALLEMKFKFCPRCGNEIFNITEEWKEKWFQEVARLQGSINKTVE